MKPLQIAALVIAGALGGAILMKTVQKPAEIAQIPMQPQNPTVPQQPPAEQPAPIRIPSVAAPQTAPAVGTPTEPKPSPIAEAPQAAPPVRKAPRQPQQHAAVRR